MSFFRKAVDRLSDLLLSDGKVTYRTRIDTREVYLNPMLDRITADDDDGDALRMFLIRSIRGERPPIDIYRGDTSTCRIDGPWQASDPHWLPLGGLVLTPGVTAHLDPFEAQALHQRMQEAIENTILAWAREQDLYSLPRAAEAIDRDVADPVAKTMIAAWAEEQRASANGDNVESARPRDCHPSDNFPPLCAMCGRRLDHA